MQKSVAITIARIYDFFSTKILQYHVDMSEWVYFSIKKCEMQGKMKNYGGNECDFSKNDTLLPAIFPVREIDNIRFYAIMRF